VWQPTGGDDAQEGEPGHDEEPDLQCAQPRLSVDANRFLDLSRSRGRASSTLFNRSLLTKVMLSRSTCDCTAGGSSGFAAMLRMTVALNRPTSSAPTGGRKVLRGPAQRAHITRKLLGRGRDQPNDWSEVPVLFGLVLFGIGQGALVTLLFNVPAHWPGHPPFRVKSWHYPEGFGSAVNRDTYLEMRPTTLAVLAGARSTPQRGAAATLSCSAPA
jgi:hypothetical protein